MSMVESEQIWAAALVRTRQTGTILAAYSTSGETKGSPYPKCRVPMMLGGRLGISQKRLAIGTLLPTIGSSESEQY